MNNKETAAEKLEIIANTSDLATAIKRLERRRNFLGEDLKDHFHIVLEELKPTNILKHTLHELQESTTLKHNLLKVAIGLGAGYFSRKMIVGKSAGLVKKAIGTVLQYSITNFIAKKEDSNEESNFGYPSKKKSLLRRILAI